MTVPFNPGPANALQDQTDVESFAALDPDADGFRKEPEGEYWYRQRCY
jgi:catalase-peroxidase